MTGYESLLCQAFLLVIAFNPITAIGNVPAMYENPIADTYVVQNGLSVAIPKHAVAMFP